MGALGSIGAGPRAAPACAPATKQFEFVGGTGDIRVNYARTDVVPGGLKKPSDIVKASRLYVGNSAITGISGLLARLSLDVLGVSNQLVTGYRGGSDIFLAAAAQ